MGLGTTEFRLIDVLEGGGAVAGFCFQKVENGVVDGGGAFGGYVLVLRWNTNVLLLYSVPTGGLVLGVVGHNDFLCVDCFGYSITLFCRGSNCHQVMAVDVWLC
jgi:hypothetical protein